MRPYLNQLVSQKFDRDILRISLIEKLAAIYRVEPAQVLLGTSKRRLLMLLEKALGKKFAELTIVDESYLEFSDALSVLCESSSNLVVERSLSKAYALDALGIKVMLMSKDVAAKFSTDSNIPPICLALALDSLSATGLIHAKFEREKIVSERKRMADELAKLAEVEQINSEVGDFVVLKVKDTQKIINKLQVSAIDGARKIDDGAIEIKIKSEAENNLVLAALGIISFLPSNREATVIRKTNETEIRVKLNLSRSSPAKITTGIGFFDHMLEQLAKHSGITLEINCSGDLHIDIHHTVEDIAIALGEALKKALGDKKGIQRYGFVLAMDEAQTTAALDLSGRGVLRFEAEFPDTRINDFAVEMVEHFFYSLAMNLGAAIQLKVSGKNTHHMIESCFKAFALTLKQAVREGSDLAIPSTKGIL